MIMQIAVAHSPADVRICVCAAPERIGRWEWVKWLPHNAHPTEADAAGPVRLMAPGLAGLDRMLGSGLRERPRFSPGGRSGSLPSSVSLPFLVVIVDGGGTDDGSVLPGADGVVVIDLTAPQASGYEPGTLGLLVTGGQGVTGGQVYRLAKDAAGQPVQTLLGTADALSAAEAETRSRPAPR
jgi:S-DNA-T family DNA segregation ATPase FtsK/SpoIIIE